MAKPDLEVANIFREYGETYRQKFGTSMSPAQLQVMHAIEICRTAVLGGHVDQCDHCGHQVISYNSCRNRHCPKCQSLAKAEWLEARRTELLPVGYYHVVFTIPENLNSVVLQNKCAIYNILFKAVSQTLLTIAADPKHLGAKIGFTTILHTWGQNLMFHPHLHCVVPGGGLSVYKQKWIWCRKKFFLPVRVLSCLFRNRFLDLLMKAYDNGTLQFHNNIAHLGDGNNFKQFLKKNRKKVWVVYAKPPFGGPEKVMDYLGRYTHRIAISNHRLISLENGKVSFIWRDYRQGNKQRIMILDTEEFMRRFLLHALPSGFVRIRYYGFLCNRYRTHNLELCRKLLDVSENENCKVYQPLYWKERYEIVTGKSVDRCPLCGKGQLITIQHIRPIIVCHKRSPPN